MDALSLLGRALVVFLLLGATLWAVRRSDGLKRLRKAETPLEVLGSARLGKGASVALVRIGDADYALGVTDQAVSLLTEAELGDDDDEAEGDARSSRSFQAALTEQLGLLGRRGAGARPDRAGAGAEPVAVPADPGAGTLPAGTSAPAGTTSAPAARRGVAGVGTAWAERAGGPTVPARPAAGRTRPRGVAAPAETPTAARASSPVPPAPTRERPRRPQAPPAARARLVLDLTGSGTSASAARGTGARASRTPRRADEGTAGARTGQRRTGRTRGPAATPDRSAARPGDAPDPAPDPRGSADPGTDVSSDPRTDPRPRMDAQPPPALEAACPRPRLSSGPTEVAEPSAA